MAASLRHPSSLPREARDTLFLLAVIAWVVLPQVEHLPWWCSAGTAAVLVWRGLLALQGKPLPGKWWLGAALVLTIGATLLTYKTLLGRDAGVTLTVVLLALKTLELRARRDAFVVFFLGFFTMLTNFFFSQSLLTAGAMLVGLLGLLTALVNAHMPVGKPPLIQAARTAAWMVLLGAPMMAVLFLLFPRLAPLWGIPSDGMTGRSGLSARMEVGTIANLALDDSVAMRVRFAGDTPPPQRDLYFRGPVLTLFDGREWRPLSARRERVPYGQPPPNLEVAGPAVRYEVTLEPNNLPWVFVIEAASPAPTMPGFEPFMTPELQWIANKPVTDIVRYAAVSYPQFRHGPRGLVPALQDSLDLPPARNPRTVALGTQLRAGMKNGAADNRAIAQLALDRLRTGGYSYVLDPGVYGNDTADEFWFDKKEGFCEHIASAFVVLMRAAGVPARIVTGYQGGERNSVDGYWTVRQSDAHAWSEIWVPNEGWVRVDPTASVAPGRVGTLQRLQAPRGVIATALGGVSPELALNLRSAWEALNNSWNQWVLSYTQSKQIDMLKNLGFESPGWEDLSYVLIAIIVGVSLLGAAWTLWERSRHDPWLRLLERTHRRLAKAGMPLPGTTPPRQTAAAVTQRFGTSAQALADWLLRLEAQRYARDAGDRKARLATLQREYKQLAWPA